MLIGAVGTVLTAYSQTVLLLTLALTLSTIGLLAVIPIFWSLPTGFLTGSAAAAGIGAIAAIGNLGGFGGPAFTGAMEDSTGDFVTPFIVLAGLLVVGCLLTLLVREPAAVPAAAAGRSRGRRARGLKAVHNGPVARRAAIVGAGPAGLTALVALTRAGLDATCFEKGDRPGGLWAYGAPLSGAYRSLHLNTSKARTELAGFPMPDDWPDFPSHERIGEYFRRYVDEEGVRERIRFGAAVTRAERRQGGGWSVTAEDGFEEEFDVLVVASGHNWEPRLPDPPYPGDFDGTQIHAHDYREPDLLEGRGVLVVGMGNSAMDIAVESSTVREAHLPLHPARHADRAQVRVRKARRPGHLAHDGAASLAPAPAAHPRPAARGGGPARDLRPARPRGRLPAQPPHDLRRRAVAPHARRDPAQARASSRSTATA